MSRYSINGWVGFDLDGTLAEYDHGQFPKIGKPVASMVQLFQEFRAVGVEVRILTARVSSDDETENELQRKLISDWCMANLKCVVPVTCKKDYGMWLLIDDRALGVQSNQGQIMYSSDLNPTMFGLFESMLIKHAITKPQLGIFTSYPDLCKEVGARLKLARERAGLTVKQVEKMHPELDVNAFESAEFGVEFGENLTHIWRNYWQQSLELFCELYQCHYLWLIGAFTADHVSGFDDEQLAKLDRLKGTERATLLDIIAMGGPDEVTEKRIRHKLNV